MVRLSILASLLGSAMAASKHVMTHQIPLHQDTLEAFPSPKPATSLTTMVRASGRHSRAFNHLRQGGNAQLQRHVHKLGIFLQAIVAASDQDVGKQTMVQHVDM